MSEQFDSENLMYITKEYENNLRETARKIYSNDEVKLTIENIDKQLNDILIEMNDKLNFISGKIHDPETGVDVYLEGVHTQIDNIEVDARDMIDDGVETTQSHPSVMSVKSDRNATKFNTYDFINKSIRLDANSPLLRFNSKNGLEDDDNVHTFRINHDKKEYIKIIEFSFTYRQYPSVMNKNDDVLEEEPTVTVTRVISGRFFIIWEDPFNEPGKFIIKAIVENADNTGNIIDKKVIDVKELSKLKEVNYIKWKNTNITSGYYYCITVANDGTLVAGSGLNYGIKYSNDNGKTWNNTNITSGVYKCITVANDGRLVAGGGSIVYSDDNGKTWNNTNITSGSYYCITVAKDGTLVAGGDYTVSIKYSKDNGVTWNNSNITSGSYTSYNCITIANDDTLVAGSNSNNGIKYSTDSGKTWIDSSITTGSYSCITVANDGRLVAGGGSIVYSDDNGKTWNNTNITSGVYKCITVANDGRLVAGSNGYGIKYSDDNGITWNDSNITSGYYYCIILANDGTLVAGSINDVGIKYSTDDGITWNDGYSLPSMFITLVNNDRLMTSFYSGQGSYGISYLDIIKTEIEDLSVILDDGPQFDLYFTTEGNSIDISIGKVVPYRWLMRKNYITLDSNKPVDNISVAETLETPEFNQSNVFYSKVINTYFIVDKENHKISYVIGGNKFSNSIPLSPSTTVPYSGEEITDFRLMDTSTFTFLTINNETYASLNNFESFTKLNYKFTKVFELSTREILLLRDNGNIHLFNTTTGTVNDIVFISPKSQDLNFTPDYSISEVEGKYIVIFTSTPNGFTYKIKTIDKNTHTYGANQITSLDTEIDSTKLTSLTDITAEASTIKSVSNIYGLFVLVNHIHDGQTITNIVYLDDLIESGLSYIYKTTKVLKEFDYINQTESDISLPIKDLKATSMFMFGIGLNGELFIVDSSYVVRAIKTIPSGDLYSDEKSMLYLEKDKNAEDLFLVENPYCNNVIDVIETPNGVFIVDKNGIYEVLDTKELHCLIYTEDEFVSSIPEADINSLYGVFVAKNGDNYKFYKTNYDTKIIPRTHIKYKYIDLFNDLYQKYEEDKPVNEYDDELPIVKFNSILYVNFIDHLSSIYNTDKYNSIRYISDKTYGDVKIGLPIDKTFTQIKNDGTSVSKVGTFINKKFTLSTNKYGFKKYKDIIKIGDNVRVSDINEVKRYVIRNEKDSGKDISLISANIIKLLNDEYNFIIGDDKKTEKVKYETIYKCHNLKENENNVIGYSDKSKFKYVKKYYTSLGVINNYGYFNKLVETPIGCFIHKEYVENDTRKGAVYYVPADILINMITNYYTIPAYLGDVESGSITPLTDLVLSCGWDATKFTAIKINEQYEFDNFDAKYIDNGHDTIILTGNGLTFAYECLNPETREWSSPFSVTNKISSIEIPDNGAFTSVYVDGNNVYLWNNTEIKPLYRYNVVTKQLDNAFVNITNSSKILNLNKIENTLHVIAYENKKLVYYTIDLISNIKTVIMSEIKTDTNYPSGPSAPDDNYEPNYYIVKRYETDKCYLMLICIIRKDAISQEINNNSYSILLKFIKNQDTLYNQVNLYNNNPYHDKLTGFTICKDIENNYKIVCVNNSQKDTIFPNAFIYNEITDIITPLEIENKEKLNFNMCSDSFLDLEYNRDTGNIECINLYYLESSNEYPIDKIFIKIPGMINSIGNHHSYEWVNGEYVNGKMYKFKNFVIEYSGTRDIIRVYDFKDNKIDINRRSEFHTTDFIQDVVNNSTYMVTQDETPSQDKEYYILNTSQIHFSPINHTIKYAKIGYDVVFKRVEISTNYVLVDTVNKQKYPLKGVQYYKKDLQGNYIEVNITHFDPIVKYYEKENKFVPIKTETLLNNENLSDQYYQADKYYFEIASNTGSFDPNTVYFEKASISSISNISYVNFLEEKNNCLYIKTYTSCGTNTDKQFDIVYTLKAEVSADGLEWSLEEYHYNIMDNIINSEGYYIKDKKIKINENEYIAKVNNSLIGMNILVRCNEYCTELYNEYLNIDMSRTESTEMTDEEPYGCITQNGHVFITNIEKNKTYKLSDDYSSAILINDSHPLKIFDTESGIFGIALNTTAVLVYKFNEETGLFDDIIFDKNDGIFLRSNYDNNVCITMNDGFKAIFIFGILNNRPTCYRLYKGIVTIYNDLDPRIMCLPFNKYTIYEMNNKICFILNNVPSDSSINNYKESNVYIVDINTNKIICKTLCKPYFKYPTKIILSYFDDEKIYLISDKSGFIDYSSSDELYGQDSAKSLTPIDTYNTTLPVVDKDGFLWYKNSIVDIKTGLPDPTKYYRAYEKDKKTIRYEHIVFNDMIATEDGIFGIKDGCIYLNNSFSDSNDFVLVFSNIIEYNGTNYNIGNDSIHDVLLYSDKFGVFYHAPNGMIFRWNGSEFVCVFGNLINTALNAKLLFDDQMEFNDINIESNKVNCLFYINENILLIKNKSERIYYFDLNNNLFVTTNIINPTAYIETLIGTIIKTNNELKLITYLHKSINISIISHSGEYLYTTDEYNGSIDMDRIIEDPISKTIIILSNTPNGECYVIDKTDDGYKLFTAHVSEDIGTDFTNDIIYRKSNNKILTNKRSFNVKFNEDKTDLIFENIQIFDTPLSALFEVNEKIYGLTNIDETTSNLVALSYNGSTKNYEFENVYTNIFINRGITNSYNYLDYCCGLDWNGILFISFSSKGLNGRGNILLSYGKIFERTINHTDEAGNVGFDLTFTIKNSNIFNNLDEITENSLIDKLVIKTTGVFTKGSILNLNSYIINNQRYKNLKEIESKYPSVFNLYKNIYKRFDNKNLMSYRFNEVLSNSDDSLVLGSIDKISKAEFNDLVSKILKIQELNDDYKVEINVYPAAVTKVETVKETFTFGADGGEDMPKLDRVPYLPFDPFRDDDE